MPKYEITKYVKNIWDINVNGDTSCSILPKSSIRSGDKSEYDWIIGMAEIHWIVINAVNIHEYKAINLTSSIEIILLIASDHLPPILFWLDLDVVELKIYMARNIAKKSKIDDDKIKSSSPELKYDAESLIANSEPNIAPKDPPAIIIP